MAKATEHLVDIAVVHSERETQQDTRAQITDDVTRLVAATILCHRDFPSSSDLPRVASIPFNNLGHLMLVDYDLLARILWGATTTIKREVNKSGWNAGSWVIRILLLVVIVAITAAAFSSDNPASGLAVLAVGLIGFSIITRLLPPKVAEIAASVRADQIRTLMAGSIPSSAEVEDLEGGRYRKMVSWGNAELGPDKCPVLVRLAASDPFPGFGWHQFRDLFVCRPSDEHKPPSLDSESLSRSLSAALVRASNNWGVDLISAGSVLVVDGSTLWRDSLWVIDPENASAINSSPKLFVSAEELPSASEIDCRASVRTYTAIQVLIPSSNTTLTFFIRSFLAGNSAACELNVSTLGPPRYGWESVQDSLRIHEREVNKNTYPLGSSQKPPTKMSPLGARLQSTRLRLEAQPARFEALLLARKSVEVKMYDADLLDHERQQAEKIAEVVGRWPGSYTSHSNLREIHSLSSPSDFFSNAESTAILRTLYDRICRSALNYLKEQGFDIGDYQDSAGKFTITSERIDKLIVGEKVVFESGGTETKPGVDAANKIVGSKGEAK